MKPIQDPSYFRVLKQIQKDVLRNMGTTFTGPSPPEVFVGDYNYPNVFSGILAPVINQESTVLSSPEEWYKKKFSIEEIMYQRGSMIYSRFSQPVKATTKLTETMQEVSMAKKIPDIHFDLKKKPTINIKIDGVHQPVFNPAPLKFAKLENNPGVAKRVDYIISDTHLKAKEGMLDLYKHHFDTTKINRLLSSGVLGVKSQRKLVPTRWAITATDDTISEFLIRDIKHYNWIENVELYHGDYLGNHYEILLIPRQWSFEVIEAKWNANPEYTTFWQDYESHFKRKTYATDVVGGYYAVRLAITEHLKQRKKQATAFVMRQVKDYDAPCGVGILRELTRDILTKKPETFSTITQAINHSQNRMIIHPSLYTQKSELLKEMRTQRSLLEYH